MIKQNTVLARATSPRQETQNERNQSGFMPRGEQMGYIFSKGMNADDLGTVIAHELGHGVYQLKHPFDNSYGLSQNALPDNLMDYGNGSHLAKWQWDLVFDPGIVMKVFERDGDAMGVKWGQLGNLHQIMEEVRYSSYSLKIESMLEDRIKHFGQNRIFTRNESGDLVDAPGSVNVKRYLYTEKIGWIDMEHFFSLANYTRKHGIIASSIWAYVTEEIQNTPINFLGWKWNRTTSAYSYEDVPSDFAGIEFWMRYGKK